MGRFNHTLKKGESVTVKMIALTSQKESVDHLKKSHINTEVADLVLKHYIIQHDKFSYAEQKLPIS